MSNLPTEIRRIVDMQVTPIDIGEVKAKRVDFRGPIRPIRMGFVASGLALLLAVCGVLLVTQRHSNPRPHDRTVLSSLPAGLVECLANPSVGEDGCPVSIPVAEQMMGIVIPEPMSTPAGWVVIMQDVRQWPSDYADIKGVIPADFNQVWAPPKTDLQSTEVAPMFIQYNVQSAANYTAAGIQENFLSGPAITLPNGLVVHGVLSAADVALNWVANGNVYRIRTGSQPTNVSSVEAFVESLK
jgi:hypothetical protein